MDEELPSRFSWLDLGIMIYGPVDVFMLIYNDFLFNYRSGVYIYDGVYTILASVALEITNKKKIIH
jgi:hypothetical protein